jgi:hypothetical protein
LLYDGTNIWMTDSDAHTLLKLNLDDSIAQTINMGNQPLNLVFDSTNIWVPNINSNSVTVVRVKDTQGNPLANAFVLATLTGNGLNFPSTAAFDGERILVTNPFGHRSLYGKRQTCLHLAHFRQAMVLNCQAHAVKI